MTTYYLTLVADLVFLAAVFSYLVRSRRKAREVREDRLVRQRAMAHNRYLRLAEEQQPLSRRLDALERAEAQAMREHLNRLLEAGQS